MARTLAQRAAARLRPSDRRYGGITCRAAAGECDIAETCNGIELHCPEDRFAHAGTLSRPTTAPICDPAEYCLGAMASCPPDVRVCL